MICRGFLIKIMNTSIIILALIYSQYKVEKYFYPERDYLDILSGIVLNYLQMAFALVLVLLSHNIYGKY